jgi:hypothetical protein
MDALRDPGTISGSELGPAFEGRRSVPATRRRGVAAGSIATTRRSRPAVPPGRVASQGGPQVGAAHLGTALVATALVATALVATALPCGEGLDAGRRGARTSPRRKPTLQRKPAVTPWGPPPVERVMRFELTTLTLAT